MNMNPVPLKALVATCVALLLCFGTVVKADSVNGVVKSATGDAYLTDAAGAKLKITTGMVIPAGSQLFTDANSTVGLQLVPGATTVVTPGSEVGFLTLNYAKASDNSVDRKVALNLKKGSVFSSLFHGPGKSEFTVRTPAGVAAARGTDWVVTVSDTGETTYQVLGGTVNLTLPDGTVVAIPAGDQYSTVSGLTKMTGAEILKLIKVITNAGFSLSHSGSGGTGPGSTFNYKDGTTTDATLNPANLSGSGTQSPNQ